jgi:hypothetical protein
VPHTETGTRACKQASIGRGYLDSLNEVSEAVRAAWAIPMQWSTESTYAAGLIVLAVGDDGHFRRVG